MKLSILILWNIAIRQVRLILPCGLQEWAQAAVEPAC